MADAYDVTFTLEVRMEETVTTFGETTEWWLATFYGPLLWLIDFLSGLLSLVWS